MTVKSYNRQTTKFLEVVENNMPELPRGVTQGWIENPKAVKKVLEKTFCPPETAVKVWKTIQLGTGPKTGKDFLKALEDNGFTITNQVKNIIEKKAFAVVTEATEIDLVKVTTAELNPTDSGFSERAMYYETCDRARIFGLEQCPFEIGLQLRLQHKDQSYGESVFVAMKPFIDSNGIPSIFCVERGGGPKLTLSSVWIKPQIVRPGDSWIFCLPRNK